MIVASIKLPNKWEFQSKPQKLALTITSLIQVCLELRMNALIPYTKTGKYLYWYFRVDNSKSLIMTTILICSNQGSFEIINNFFAQNSKKESLGGEKLCLRD